ncbi:hypothetical protein LHV26_20665 [Providencia stuartii]|jgi:hypothetical protein|nr:MULTISPECIES: hypothetical protein [Enterobacterales]MCB5219641.1 hypothetical protein [Providencia stuartii]WAK46036.1 hypothetical protein [Klebsiella pneumoniae]BEG97082.1 hypothetical protein [Klebsiella pneumoniae]BEG97406.1 hypothetical protein [Klebsiella pneumoniae]
MRAHLIHSGNTRLYTFASYILPGGMLIFSLCYEDCLRETPAMYLMFKRSPRYILMIVIMAVGMMMSSMGTFASHGTNGLTGYEMNLHDAEVTMTVQDHSHDSDIPQSGHAGHHQTDHFHETPQQPPSVEISLSPVADRWLPLADLRSPVKATDIIYRPPSTRQI